MPLKSANNAMLRTLFFRHIGQTSPAPMGLEITHGKGNYLYDVAGKKYLDLIAGISVSNIGHGNPKVVEAIKNQADAYLHTLVYGEHIQAIQVRLAEAIVATLPTPLDQVFFVNSGSEAIEGAMKLAKRYTGKPEITACSKAYHGSSHGALSLNGDEYFRRNFRPLLPGIGQIEFGNPADFEKITEKTAAVVIEAVQGEAGIRVAPPSYFAALKQRCSETGTLIILDEIQTGFGRTGTFWKMQSLGIVPDIVVMAKGMGGGMPLGAFAAPVAIMQTLTENPVLGHISTFGGNPVCCAASLATLEYIQENRLVEMVPEKNTLFCNLLQHSCISEIRSAGLMLAVELGSFDRVLAAITYCLENGLISDWFLHCNTALRIAPPLTISNDEIEWACRVLVEAIEVAEKRFPNA